ncbi:hypothetical protein MYA_2684 [Burkholderia sp. KJ006]|nr:hypothetical protein MYA_2684 [Burkholderia sp. KJ006]
MCGARACLACTARLISPPAAPAAGRQESDARCGTARTRS